MWSLSHQLSGGLPREDVDDLFWKAQTGSPASSGGLGTTLGWLIQFSPMRVLSETRMWIMSRGGGLSPLPNVSKGRGPKKLYPYTMPH